MDPKLKTIYDGLLNDLEVHSLFSLHHDSLYKHKLLLSSSSKLIPQLLWEAYDSLVRGHEGFLRTYKRLSQSVGWWWMMKSIKDHVDKCQICHHNKVSSLAQASLLQALTIPQQVWKDISIDFIEGLSLRAIIPF